MGVCVCVSRDHDHAQLGTFFIPQITLQMANLCTEFEVPADVYPLRRRLNKTWNFKQFAIVKLIIVMVYCYYFQLYGTEQPTVCRCTVNKLLTDPYCIKMKTLGLAVLEIYFGNQNSKWTRHFKGCLLCAGGELLCSVAPSATNIG